MQSISTNNLFVHGHEKWGLAPPTRKSEKAIAPLPPRFHGLWPLSLYLIYVKNLPVYNCV